MYPKILKLDAAGFPQKWITFEDYAFYYAKDLILWDMSPSEIVLRGGTNSRTGIRSEIPLQTIVSIKGDVQDPSKRRVPLKNEHLFRREKNRCGYCGNTFSNTQLTRDHVVPVSRGGPNVWENVVTSCKSCNSAKDARTPEEWGHQLLYVPYAPSFAEYLILRNHNILADQMDFLLVRVPEDRRGR
jgi:5-methylcytosine-specific restriction endonuclease McrA